MLLPQLVKMALEGESEKFFSASEGGRGPLFPDNQQ